MNYKADLKRRIDTTFLKQRIEEFGEFSRVDLAEFCGISYNTLVNRLVSIEKGKILKLKTIKNLNKGLDKIESSISESSS